MHVLKLHIPDSTTHVRVIQLLGIHVEEVCVALLGFQASQDIRIAQARDLHEGLQGSNEGEFVEVPRCDYRRVWVLRKDGGDESLQAW